LGNQKGRVGRDSKLKTVIAKVEEIRGLEKASQD